MVVSCFGFFFLVVKQMFSVGVSCVKSAIIIFFPISTNLKYFITIKGTNCSPRSGADQ